MNWDIVKGNWNEWKGKAQQEWGKLTDDELQQADGRREEMVGLLQQKYGHSKDEAEQAVDDWLKKVA